MSINYNALSNYYNAKQLIPIIGHELLKIRKGIDQNGKDVLLTFEEYLIEHVSGMNYIDEQCPKTISELALRYPRLNSSDIISAYNLISPENFVTELLDKLVQLKKFDFFIYTTYDRKLEELMQNDVNSESEAIFWNHEKRDPLYINFDNKTRKIIYLFGGINNNEFTTEEISFNDEDRLECLFCLFISNSQNPSRSTSHFSFLEYLRGKILLFIGNNFQDWFMRILIRTLYNSPYKNNLSKAYIINDENSRLGFERYFFEKYGIQIIHDSPIETVIKTLFNTIQGAQEFRERYKHKVFISYDRNDIEYAQGLNTKLKNLGINSWIDTRDLGISSHRDEIKKIIEGIDTRIFVCILSKALIEKDDEISYVKSFEWKCAENRMKVNNFMKQRGDIVEEFLIIPVAIDNYKSYIKELPLFIERENIQDYLDEKLTSGIEEKLKTQKA